MIEIQGAHNTAKVFTDTLDDASREQIQTLCSQAFTAGSVIRLMPDVHAGAGCTIGTTMTITDKIVPNLVGVDIGCGMETMIIKADSEAARSFDPVKLDAVIHARIPCGRDIRDAALDAAAGVPLDRIRCPAANCARARKSIGTLGGGNHFIEADRDDDGNLYIVVHSGSRHLGLEVAEYYQEEAWKQLNRKRDVDIHALIEQMKAEGRQQEIQKTVKALKGRVLTSVPQALAYVQDELFEDYISDMKITQQFARVNRTAMMGVIREGMGIAEPDIAGTFTTIHNYIDTDAMILRKGAVSAQRGETLLIPMNMRDGSLICEGLGNPDWNYSAPHGAGRLMSRKKAFAAFTMEEFTRSMEGVYSTTVSRATLDESPMAYKAMADIIAHIGPAAKILRTIKPVYNFKAAE